MINGKRVVVIMPAYNAARTLRATYAEVPRQVVDEVILTDDFSSDETVALAGQLGLKVFRHQQNMGYGANQKPCYTEALKSGADIIVMLHPDYQYTPKLIEAMAYLIANDLFDVVIGSRILGRGAVSGGMPRYKYFFNRILTLIQNFLMNQKLSEYHSGYRAFRREVLTTLPLLENSDDFVFDNQMLAQTLYFGFRVGEISCPTRYNRDSSSITFLRSIKYGFGVLLTSFQYLLESLRIRRYRIFDRHGRRLTV